MVSLSQIFNQVVPEQTSEVILRGRDGPVSSLLPLPMAWCTLARHAQVGQEGIGKADQIQLCNRGPKRRFW
jgi:hypothetical protein